MIVLEGELRLGDKAYERFSCAYFKQDESTPDLKAGPGGAQLLWLTYPAPAESVHQD